MKSLQTLHLLPLVLGALGASARAVESDDAVSGELSDLQLPTTSPV